MQESEIKEIYGKSIWDMTSEELVKNNLVEIWVKLVDENVME